VALYRKKPACAHPTQAAVHHRSRVAQQPPILLQDRLGRCQAVLGSDLPRRHKVRRIKLAMKAGTNYTACNRHVAWLAKVNWVSVQDSEIGLTDAAYKCARAFLSVSQ
jgi:hypothetical protein